MNEIWPQLGAKRIDLADEQDFAVGGLRVYPAALSTEMNGERVELQPRVMQVLVALAHARPNVVSREKLIDACWEGRIVGDDALNRCVLALRHLAQRFTPAPFTIETVPRVGHRMIDCTADGATNVQQPRRIASRRSMAVGALLLASAGAGLLVWQQRSAQAEPASIAVLPFRNLSAGDPYFAEGVGEEILGQLAREPQFRVAGSTSSSQAGKGGDVREAARKLNVDYVVEGSVRRQGDQVRVNAALLRAKDGARLWSNTFNGKLDDVLAIQSAVGQAVADGLKRKLVFSTARAARPVNGEAYALYLNARGLLRSGIAGGGEEAIRLLQGAIRIDPAFAPAWSSMAEAMLLAGRTRGNEGMIAIVPQARDAARRALRLDPNVGESHAVLAEFLGSDSPEAIAERMRAADLDGRTGEGQLWRAGALQASGRWQDAIVAMRRAHDLDPSWSQPWRTMLDATATLGDVPGAQAAIKGGFSEDAMLESFARARLAWFTGDFSEAARRWSELANGQSQWAGPSKLSLENALFTLHLSNRPPSRPPRPTVGQSRSTPANVWMASAPPAAEWQRRNRSSAAELVYRDENVIAAKLMLTTGRTDELVATYESPTGLLGIRPGQPMGTCFLQSAAIVAIALRAEGRAEEANNVLRQSDSIIKQAYSRGSVPLWFEDDAAIIWALQGKRDLAVAALDRAYRRGSTHTTRTDLPRLTDEPGLRSLLGYPRFEVVRARYEAHFAKERSETAGALKIKA